MLSAVDSPVGPRERVWVRQPSDSGPVSTLRLVGLSFGGWWDSRGVVSGVGCVGCVGCVGGGEMLGAVPVGMAGPDIPWNAQAPVVAGAVGGGLAGRAGDAEASWRFWGDLRQIVVGGNIR